MTLQELLHNQKQFCKDRGYPMFIPSNGECYRCHTQLWLVVSEEDSKRTLITGCPSCHISFCG